MGLHVDPKEPYDVLEHQVKEAELDADYQEQVRQYERKLRLPQEVIERSNARCPNPVAATSFKTNAEGGAPSAARNAG